MSTSKSSFGHNSYEVKSSISTRFNQEFIERKHRQREKLLSNFIELNENTHKREEMLREQINDISVRIEVLRTKRNRTIQNYSMQKESFDSRLAFLNSNLEQISSDLAKAHIQKKTLEENSFSEQSETLKTFKISLRPLEEALKVVSEERVQTEQNILGLTERLQGLENEYTRLTDQIELNKKEAEGLRLNKTQLDNAFEEVKLSSPLEFNEAVKEIDTQRHMALLIEKKSKQGSELNATDRKIAEMERDLAKASAELEKWERQRRSGCHNQIEENQLNEQERELAFRCQDMGLIQLDQAVVLATKERGIDIARCIKKEQYKLIEDYELKMTERAKVQNETFEKKIQELNSLIHMHKEGKLGASDSERTLIDLEHSIMSLKMEAEYFNRKNTCNLGNIQQWKLKNKTCIDMHENPNWPTDPEIINEFRAANQNSLIKADEFSDIEGLLSKYIKILEQRNGVTNVSSAVEIKANSEIKQQKNFIKMLISQLNSLQYERENIHKEFIKLVNNEKIAKNKLENLRKESEVERNKMIQARLQGVLKKKIAEMQRIHRGFGEASIKRVKEHEYNKLKLEFDTRRTEIKQKIEELYSNQGYWDSLISALQNSVNPGRVDELWEEIETIKSQIESFKAQTKIICEAEDELTAKMESMLEVKKKEISKNYSVLVLKNSIALDKRALDELDTLKEAKIEEIELVNYESQAIKEKYDKQIKVLTDEEHIAQNKLNKLHEEFQQIVQSKNKALNVQRKLKALEAEMENIGMTFLTPEKPEHHHPTFEDIAGSAHIERLNEEDDESSSESLQTAQDIVRQLKLEIEVDKPTDSMGAMVSPVSLSSRADDKSWKVRPLYKFNIEEALPEEKKMLKSLIPLLDGCLLYKKFSSHNSMHLPEFDPLLADKTPVEACGYGIRSFVLSCTLESLEIIKTTTLSKRSSRQRRCAEKRLLISKIKAPIIPRLTMEIIKAQKKQWLLNQEDEDPAHEETYLDMKMLGTIVYEDPAFQVRSRRVKFYPFFICMEDGGRVEIVAEDYVVFKQWIDGLNALVKWKKHLPRLRYMIEPCK